MKNLYLSDIHLGNPFFDEENFILELLRRPYKEIFIIGDFLDVWEDGLEDILKRYSSIIEEIKSNEKITILKGNHDPSIAQLNKIFKHNLVQERFFDANLDFMLSHGHEFDKLITKHDWLAKLLYPLQWTLERVGLDISYFLINLFHSVAAKRDKKYYNDLVLDIEQNLVSEYSSYKAIIVGHTHIPKIVEAETTYINCGDWPHNQSYVEYDLDSKKFELKFKNK